MSSHTMHDARLLADAQRVADAVLAGLEGHGVVVVATIDGFDLAEAGSRPVNRVRLSAMVSSIAALGDAASVETGIGATRCLVVESSEGRLVVRCMQSHGQAVVVVVLTDRSVLLGLVWNQLASAERLLLVA
ncbi:roadblock/LC7 domain-containing protein [Rhizobacter sp. Root1221]|uniref:roadblock/LC7 domain-containing protein n=1 Tax=Rhizobacter sp. Root1221 TaxID=1736433 RepID=UPI0007163048|nr:roadblock/LC7 domain-containing protein [Rhizobacter sp. Root1221]KQV85484.1 hypothetical protein ASC87_07280 [Rhizobacter sp. Root1221]